MSTKAIWAKSTWNPAELAPPVYWNSIPIILPVGARLEVKERRTKQTTTQTITVRMPR